MAHDASEMRLGLTAEAIDNANSVWRQGDCVLQPQWFMYRVPLAGGITSTAQQAAAEGAEIAEEEVPGLIVLTQTCDIVRSCVERPYVELSPLVEVTQQFLRDVENGRRPSFAYVPTLDSHRLVADLDRVMTIEKSVLAQWNRVPGWTADSEIRAFAAALARKRQRFAFPDDFAEFVRPLQSRLIGKHEKASNEGRALRALREIRVLTLPSWDDPSPVVTFYFIRTGEADGFTQEEWAEHLAKWLNILGDGTRFKQPEGQVTTLEGLTAAEYVASDPLDLDHLSS